MRCWSCEENCRRGAAEVMARLAEARGRAAAPDAMVGGGWGGRRDRGSEEDGDGESGRKVAIPDRNAYRSRGSSSTREQAIRRYPRDPPTRPPTQPAGR